MTAQPKESIEKRSVQQKCTVAVLHFRGGSLMATGISLRVLGMFPTVLPNQVSGFEVLDLMASEHLGGQVLHECNPVGMVSITLMQLMSPCCLHVLMSSSFFMQTSSIYAMCRVAFKVQPSEEDRQTDSRDGTHETDLINLSTRTLENMQLLRSHYPARHH